MNTRIRNSILSIIEPKARLRQEIERVANEVFESLAQLLEDLIAEYKSLASPEVLLKFERPSRHVAVITVDVDTLVFYLHPDVFQFDRDHGVWETKYVEDDKLRSYSCIINVFNFLADTVKYDREEDMGYLVARLFVNNERKFFVEGKRQRGMGFDHYGEKTLDNALLRSFVETALKYAAEFDLLVPPYDTVKLTDYDHLKQLIATSKTKTAKRMGFSFNSDDVR